jgi:hypothetical protein
MLSALLVLRCGVAMLAAVASGCASSRPSAPDTAAAGASAAATAFAAAPPPAPAVVSSKPVDPLSGAYPQILWHCNVWRIPAECYFTHDGLLCADGGPKSNGMFIATSEQWQATTQSIRSLPEATHLASPAVLAKPGALARIEQHQKDKAGASSGEHSIAVMGTLDGESITTTLEVVNHDTAGLVSCESGPRALARGGSLYLLCPGPDPTQPWTLVSVHPVVLRSVADYSFQRANALMEEKPAPAK